MSCAYDCQHFWPGHDVLVAAQLGAAAHGREVGAGLGLGVGEREVAVAALDRRQPARALRVVAVARDRLRDDARRERRARRARIRHFVPQDVLVGDRLPPPPAAAGQPSDSQPRSASAAKNAFTRGQRWPWRKNASRSW
jgi:hypothetical protein